MALVNFTDLDFDQIKTSIKDYLRSNSTFTDYDYEGSNLSTIIDTLAYNTYITSYNANMLSNEVFIDSATLRENVVSLARNIGYTPRSKRSSRANISFFVDTSELTSQPEVITLNKGPVIVTNTANRSTTGSNGYVFNLQDDVSVTVTDNVANFNNILVLEGTYITTTFTVNSYDPDQRFILPNANIDTSTIRVNVKPSAGSLISRKYKQADNLFDVTSQSPVFWVQEVEDERYELIFGDGVYGLKPDAPSQIEVTYLVTFGELANGVSGFTFLGKLTSSRDSTTITGGVSPISTQTAAFGGQAIEGVSSIKKYASRIYSAQNRAVTSSDYEAIIPKIYPESESVSAFGGEELTPPQFGRVFISIKPINGTYLSNTIKQNLKANIKQYAVAGIVPEIIDLKYLYIEPTVNAYYNSNLAKSASSITNVVTQNISQYADSNEVNRFGARFKYSKFLGIIDNSSDAITSNITTISIRRDLRPVLNSFAEYEICFGNRFHVKNHGHSPSDGVGYNIKSSGFSVSGILGTVYLADVPNTGLETGIINLIQLNSSTEAKVVKGNVGTIDYIKGEVKLAPINITGTTINEDFPLIQISALPYSNDVIGLQDLYLQVDMKYASVTSKPDNISSGNDISGSNYIVTSSFANGALARGPIKLANQISTLPSKSIPDTTTSSSTSTTAY